MARLRNTASNVVYTGTLNLSAGDKTTDAVLNAFGMAEGGLASDGSNFIDMFVDNVNYSTATPTFPMAQFEVATSGGVGRRRPCAPPRGPLASPNADRDGFLRGHRR